MEPAEQLSFDDVLAEIVDFDTPLQYTTLSELSDLNQDENSRLEQVWLSINAERREQIIRKLIELAENNATLDFDAVFKIGLNDSDEGVAASSIEGLWENEDLLLIDSFIRLLDMSLSATVRSAAASALGKYAMMAELGKLEKGYSDKVVSALVRVLEDAAVPASIWRKTLESAAPLNIPQVRQAITDAYYSTDHSVKASALYAMGRNCDPSWLSILIQEIESGDDEMKFEAAGACGELGEEEAVPYLISLVDDPDTDIRLAAIQALGKIGGDEAKDFLSEYLEESDEAIREAMEEALDEIDFDDDPLAFRFK